MNDHQLKCLNDLRAYEDRLRHLDDLRRAYEDSVRRLPTDALEGEFMAQSSNWKRALIRQEFRYRIERRPGRYGILAKGGLALEDEESGFISRPQDCA